MKIDLSREWRELPIRPKRIQDIVNYTQCHPEPLLIKKIKWEYLQFLKSILPKDCQLFYDTLRYDPEH